MAPPKGSQYYLLAKEALGRRRRIQTAEEFINKLLAYISWCEENPILTKKASKRVIDTPSDEDPDKKRNEARMDSESKRRPMSERGFCIYLGFSLSWLVETTKNLDEKGSKRTEEEDNLFNVIKYARDFFANQQFDGAAIGDFNANLIMRNLGMSEKTDVTTDGTAISTSIPIINIIRDNRKAGDMDGENHIIEE